MKIEKFYQEIQDNLISTIWSLSMSVYEYCLCEESISEKWAPAESHLLLNYEIAATFKGKVAWDFGLRFFLWNNNSWPFNLL